MSYNDYSHISNAKDVPQVEHYAVVYTDRVSYYNGYEDRDGSDNSYTADALKYIKFSSLDALKQWIEENNTSKYSKVGDYKVLLVKPCEIKVTVDIKVDIS